MAPIALSNEELRWRLFNVFPAHDLGLNRLLELLDICYDKRVKTACVSMGIPPRMRFNPKFVEENCGSEEHLLMLLMHELYHIILGHTRLFKTSVDISNIAFDAVINSMLCRSFPGEEYISFFKGLYLDTGIEALLRPPDGWGEDEREIQWKLEGDLLQLHKGLYTEEGDVTYKDIYDDLLSNLLEARDIVLIGDHQGKGMGYLENNFSRSAFDALNGIVGKWPAHDPTAGRDQGLTTIENLITIEKPKMSLSRVIRSSISRLAFAGAGNVRRSGRRMNDSLLPYPTIPDRKAMVLRTMGSPTLFYKGRVSGFENFRAGRVRVYVDVSGSMDEYLEQIFSVLVHLRSMLHQTVHAFSTEIHDHTHNDILEGRYNTTGGTDINCVAQHMIEHGVKRAAIITDGMVGELEESFKEKLPKCLETVRLLVPPNCREGAEELNGRTVELPL